MLFRSRYIHIFLYHYFFTILQSHNQLQNALDADLAKQELVHKVRFDIQQSFHQLQDVLEVGL